VVIPRNHLVEAALDAAEQGIMEPFENLFEVVRQPYASGAIAKEDTAPRPNCEAGYKTFCGT